MRSPGLIPAALGVATFLVCIRSNGGFDETTWYPAALFLLAVLVVACIALPRPSLPRPAALAAAALAAYAAWSYASILWAGQKGVAWDGANRTALYAIVFALFACWRLRARAAALVAGALGVGIAAIGFVELLGAAAASDPSSYFTQGRFSQPAGYQNANTALWFLAFWPCVALAARRELRAPLRALLAGAAVILAALALLGESRGWALTAPLAAIVYVAFAAQRIRATLTLLVVAVATAACAPALLNVYSSANGAGYGSSVSHAASAAGLAAVVTAVVVGLAALVDRRRRAGAREIRAVGTGLAVVAALGVAVALIVFVAGGGSPAGTISKGWHSFKSKPEPKAGGGSRFGASLGSNRYDFWRVAWGRFADRPVAGIGADNFQQDYLARRRSDEEPRYPHSIELRTLAQTGLVGFALLATAVAAGLAGAWRARRARPGLGGAAAAAAFVAFVYWILHGSVDWFFEFAGLAAPAFALLGLAAGLEPRPARARWPVLRPRGRTRGAIVLGAGALVAVALALSFAGPWLAARDEKQAAAGWAAAPEAAFRRLDSAASLNPLSSTSKLFAASIALRVGRPQLAGRYFREVLARDPRDAFSHLELGLLEAQAGNRSAAAKQLRRALALDPRDEVAAAAVHSFEKGGRVNIAEVNQQYARQTAGIGR